MKHHVIISQSIPTFLCARQTFVAPGAGRIWHLRARRGQVFMDNSFAFNICKSLVAWKIKKKTRKVIGRTSVDHIQSRYQQIFSDQGYVLVSRGDSTLWLATMRRSVSLNSCQSPSGLKRKTCFRLRKFFRAVRCSSLNQKSHPALLLIHHPR